MYRLKILRQNHVQTLKPEAIMYKKLNPFAIMYKNRHATKYRSVFFPRSRQKIDR